MTKIGAMTIKKGAMTGLLLLISFEAQAQCVMNQDCAALGYTKTATECSGNGIKCPFGDKWSCGNTCESEGFKYTCAGSEFAGGKGSDCGEKYKQCLCTGNGEWTGSACSFCDNSCEGDEDSICSKDVHEPYKKDGCGNICYTCCDLFTERIEVIGSCYRDTYFWCVDVTLQKVNVVVIVAGIVKDAQQIARLLRFDNDK